jgi:hypothetical protein
LNPVIDVIEDAAHLVHGKAGGVGQVPLQGAFAGVDEAGVAAA